MICFIEHKTNKTSFHRNFHINVVLIIQGNIIWGERKFLRQHIACRGQIAGSVLLNMFNKTQAGCPLVLYHQNMGMVSNYRNLYNPNIGKYRNQKTRSRCRFSLLYSLHPFLFYLNKTLTDNI